MAKKKRGRTRHRPQKRRVAKRSARSSPSDISNKTVVVILLFVILASIISIGVYVIALDNARPVDEGSSVSQGVVKLQVLPRPSPTAHGKVTLEIIEPPEE